MWSCESCIKCEENNSKSIRPFSLKYLAMGALFYKIKRENDDNLNEIKKNKYLFLTVFNNELYRNLSYIVYECELLFKKNCIQELRVDQLVSHFLHNQSNSNRNSSDMIQKVQPWCICQSNDCEICFDNCNAEKRVKNGHYTDCKRFY